MKSLENLIQLFRRTIFYNQSDQLYEHTHTQMFSLLWPNQATACRTSGNMGKIGGQGSSSTVFQTKILK